MIAAGLVQTVSAQAATAAWRSGATGNWSAAYPQNIGDVAQYASTTLSATATLSVSGVTLDFQGKKNRVDASFWFAHAYSSSVDNLLKIIA